MTRRTQLAATALLLVGAVLGAPGMKADARQPFDPTAAFCGREPFRLLDPSEVAPWLAHVGGWREGRSAPPDPACASGTASALIAVLTAPTRDEAVSLSERFLAQYPVRAATVEDGDRRYLDDAEFASFVWLFCDGRESPLDCVRETAERQPADFIRSSPVFCDFADEAGQPSRAERVAWPAEPALPLLCSREGHAMSVEFWFQDALARFR